MKDLFETCFGCFFSIYSLIAKIYTLLYLVYSTLMFLQYKGMLFATFWFFTIGPIVSIVRGLLWPVFLCIGL